MWGYNFHYKQTKIIMKKSQPNKAEKCGVCFFVNNKPVFTLIKTKDEEFNKRIMEKTYFEKK